MDTSGHIRQEGSDGIHRLAMNHGKKVKLQTWGPWHIKKNRQFGTIVNKTFINDMDI